MAAHHRVLLPQIVSIAFVLLLLCWVCTARGGHKKTHHKEKKSSIPKNTIHPVSLSIEHSMPWKEISVFRKKSTIEHPVASATLAKHNGEQRKQKRGFLANLANLLTDAETISGHKSDPETVNPETALASYSSSPQKNLVEMFSNSNLNNNEGKTSVPLATALSTAAKKESTAGAATGGEKDLFTSSKEINEAVAESGKDYAPVFAMYHGKVVTLGKLPDTAFKKSDHLSTEEQQVSGKSNVEVPRDTHETKDVTGSKRHYADEMNVVKSQLLHADKYTSDSQLDTGAKLQDYLKTLNSDEKSKDTRGVAKDEVPSPLDTTGTIRSDLMGHIKGVVLDDGKVVSLPNNHIGGGGDDSSLFSAVAKQHSVLPDAQQKYYVTNDGNVEPLVKSKPEDVDAVARDNLLDSSGSVLGGQQKTVTLTVDVLKDLLKRTDSKVSLANLLNKPGEGRSDTPQEDEDPGTIEDFAAGGLKSHNAYRAKHHDDALAWSDELAAKAQKLAEALADKKTLEIAKDLEKEGMGENVAKVWATFKNAGDAATKMWYSQSSNYRFDDPHLDENTGQFAQMVWKSTRELGMGVAKSIDDVNNKYVYVTALYRPPGNIEATLRDNVMPTGNNTVDVYSTFFKRTGVITKENHSNSRRSKIQKHKKKKLKVQDDED